MTDVAVTIAGTVPVLSLAAGGVALLGTRARLAGALVLVTSVGLGCALVAHQLDATSLGWHLVAGSLLPGTFAILAYPRPRLGDWIEYCLWVTAGAASILTTVFVSLDREVSATLALVVALALICLLYTSDAADEDCIV